MSKGKCPQCSKVFHPNKSTCDRDGCPMQDEKKLAGMLADQDKETAATKKAFEKAGADDNAERAKIQAEHDKGLIEKPVKVEIAAPPAFTTGSAVSEKSPPAALEE